MTASFERGAKMKVRAVVILLALTVLSAMEAHAQTAPGCGQTDVKFDVQNEGRQHAMPSPEPGKPLIFFLQDDARFNSIPRPTTRFGIDGLWVGATHANSYFYVSVDPDEHQLCANWQSRVVLRRSRPIAATHFTAEAGKVYYFRAKDLENTERPPAVVVFEPVDSDEALVLMSSFDFNSSHPKK
jgi:hypothetical protein